ncbi:hypothetical protein FWK35_00016914 [Aphis craccivora]|uniref:Uncharacterized protein n=1 Tax=Aphis craccivora TaxID=307492 RepID=A0A6G0ZHF3_APHCR|nr:hypothetical protein FWK35_00016914 [Aphis craccivora]
MIHTSPNVQQSDTHLPTFYLIIFKKIERFLIYFSKIVSFEENCELYTSASNIKHDDDVACEFVRLANA